MDGLGSSPKEQLINNIRSTIQEIERRLKENENIISQNQLEVDRLQNQFSSAMAMLKRVEDDFDSVPRVDIRTAYERSIDVRTRLITMRSQLEKVQDAQSYLHEYRDQLQSILPPLEGVAVDRLGAGTTEDTGYHLSLGGEQLIQLLDSQEGERKQLADALHDGPTQSLSNFILQAEICLKLFDRNPDAAGAELHNLKTAASTTFQKLREYIFELRPMMLTDLGLVATLRRHADNFKQKFPDKAIEFKMVGSEKRFPPYVEVMMFRCCQTLLGNSLNVLQARQVTIILKIDDDHLTASVEDNGRYVGEDSELNPQQSDSPLHNLVDMQNRLEIVGGSLDFDSVEGTGNIAKVFLPYESTQ